ncbi:MAG: copper chaperone PCu(A)C [Balneola sp.]
MKTFYILSVSLFLVFSCSSPEKQPLSGSIEIIDGWVRPGKAGMMSAAYFNLTNSTTVTDTLFSVSSNVTTTTQIHKSYKTEDGLMGMKEQEFVPLPAGETVAFKQGGLHVMIIQPEMDLVEGDSIIFTLEFSSSEGFEVKLPVKTTSN